MVARNSVLHSFPSNKMQRLSAINYVLKKSFVFDWVLNVPHKYRNPSDFFPRNLHVKLVIILLFNTPSTRFRTYYFQ